MMVRPAHRAQMALIVLLAAGCGSEEIRLPVALGVTTDMAVGFDLRRLETTTKVDGVVARAESLSYENGTLSLPAELLSEPAQDGAEIELAIAAFRDGETSPIVTRRAATRATGERRTLLLVAFDEACSTVACGPGATCVKGACVDPFIDPSALADYDPRWIASAPDACKNPTSGPPEMVIGQGEDAFAPLSESEIVAIEAGPQGGHHLWLALRVKGLRQMGSLLTVKGRFPDLAYELPLFTSQITLRKAEEGHCEIHGVRFQVDQGLSVEAVRGQNLEIEIALKDPNGDIATAMRRVTIAP